MDIIRRISPENDWRLLCNSLQDPKWFLKTLDEVEAENIVLLVLFLGQSPYRQSLLYGLGAAPYSWKTRSWIFSTSVDPAYHGDKFPQLVYVFIYGVWVCSDVVCVCLPEAYIFSYCIRHSLNRERCGHKSRRRHLKPAGVDMCEKGSVVLTELILVTFIIARKSSMVIKTQYATKLSKTSSISGRDQQSAFVLWFKSW